MWHYHQKTGDLFHNEKKVATGYSGKGDGKNNPDLQMVKGVGPIPRGKYHIGEPYDSANTGPFCLPLHPLRMTILFGRSAFAIHGDSKKDPGNASRGCIIVGLTVRKAIYNSDDRMLEVS